jgi:hypothetical protein
MQRIQNSSDNKAIATLTDIRQQFDAMKQAQKQAASVLHIPYMTTNNSWDHEITSLPYLSAYTLNMKYTTDHSHEAHPIARVDVRVFLDNLSTPVNVFNNINPRVDVASWDSTSVTFAITIENDYTDRATHNFFLKYYVQSFDTGSITAL